MTDEQLAEIRTRYEATTPGVWYQESWKQPTPPCKGAVELSQLLCYLEDEGKPRFWFWDKDGEFVAHAHQDVPLLLAYIEYLHAERACYSPATTVS